MSKKYIGYLQGDYNTPYAKFYQINISPVSAQVEHALQTGACLPGVLPPVSEASALQAPGYAEIETGYALELDGSLRVAVLTEMPAVLPEMWDWWFGWHGSQDNRYKLWHPKAHQSAVWQDGKPDIAYIGRVSMIEEYIGARLEKANIRFLDPSELGFPDQEAKEQAVYICARVGFTQWPLDIGWLVHQIRATEGGAEMRSRFWMGGSHIQLRAKGWLPGLISKMLQKMVRLPDRQARDILVHCSEEMNHLAKFLPQLYAERHKI